VDGYMIVTHYLPGLPNRDCPAYGLWDLHPFNTETDAQLYHVFSDNIDFILNKMATRITTGDNEEEQVRLAQEFIESDRRQVEAEAARG